MVVSHPEGVGGGSANPAVVNETGAEDVDPQCALCLDRAFGVIALGEGASTGALADAIGTIGGAQELYTITARTRATIYRCKAADCSHAVLSFTVTGAPTITDASSLHLEPLPGTSGCTLPPDTTGPPVTQGP